MTWPVTFQNLPGGTKQPLSLFDTMFAQVAAMVPIPCTASGSNILTLTPFPNAPTLDQYGFRNLFSFVAPATSTGPITASYAGLPVLNVYTLGATTQAAAGDLIASHPYMLEYSGALNNGIGGFYLLGWATAFQDPIVDVRVQRFIASGTYTPGVRLVAAIFCCCGGGAGGGGAEGGANRTAGGGGGAGAYSETLVSASTIVGVQTVTIGAGGAGGAAGNHDGVNGGASSVGALITAPGGLKGSGAANGGNGGGGQGGAAGSGFTNTPGGGGGDGFRANGTPGSALGGIGGSSYYGGPGPQAAANGAAASFDGRPGAAYGAGGGGGCLADTGASAAGGAGHDGFVMIYEFLKT